MKKKTAKPSTLETIDIGDILPKEATSVDVFLFLAKVESDVGGCFVMQFDQTSSEPSLGKCKS